MSAFLKDLCFAIVDCEHKTAPIDEDGDYFAVGTPAMRGNVIDFEQARRISRQSFELWTRRMAPKFGDVLLAREAPVGPVVMIPEAENVAPGQRTVLLRPNPEKIDPQFLFYLLSSKFQQDRLQRMAAGSTVAHLNVADIREFEVEVPSIDDQRAAVALLSALDKKIASNLRLSLAVDDYLGAQFELELMKGFETGTINAIADINVHSVKPIPEEQLRYIDIASVGVGRLKLPELMKWAEAPSRARRKVRRGDTLWSTVRPGRRSHCLNLSSDSQLVASTGIAVLSPREVGFACLYEATRLKDFTSYLENVAEGSAYPAVRAERFGDAPVPLLSPTRWAAFESLAAPMRQHVQELTIESRKLSDLRDILLPTLLTGSRQPNNEHEGA